MFKLLQLMVRHSVLTSKFFSDSWPDFLLKVRPLKSQSPRGGCAFCPVPWACLEFQDIKRHIYSYTLYYNRPLSAHGSWSRLCLNLWRQGRQLNNHELDRRQGRLINFVIQDALKVVCKSRTGMRLTPFISGATSKDRCLPANPRAAGMSVWK
jgi:hypothetical protein